MGHEHAQLEALRDRWQHQANLRLEQVPHDPIAGTFNRCAEELNRILAMEAARPLTPAEYAAAHGLTVQAVTLRCRNGQLEAYQGQTGRWLIPAGARRAEAA